LRSHGFKRLRSTCEQRLSGRGVQIGFSPADEGCRGDAGLCRAVDQVGPETVIFAMPEEWPDRSATLQGQKCKRVIRGAACDVLPGRVDGHRHGLERLDQILFKPSGVGARERSQLFDQDCVLACLAGPDKLDERRD
jgi:hypothetical protein